MSTETLNPAHEFSIADPHGYRVASRINARETLRPGRRPGLRPHPQGSVGMAASAAELATHAHSAALELNRLIERMRRGDERALEELYDATVGKLFALASAMLRNADDAEEVVCATYAYAWANASRFDATRANALGWLMMLCRSRALDCLRQRRHDTPLGIEEIADSAPTEDEKPDELLSLLQQQSRVRAALEKLSPERRRLVSLAFLRGWSHQEIARATGLALGTVKSHVRRALAQLRDELECIR